MGTQVSKVCAPRGTFPSNAKQVEPSPLGHKQKLAVETLITGTIDVQTKEHGSHQQSLQKMNVCG